MAIDWDAEILGPVMAVFGETFLYIPRGGTPVTITDAVFDEENVDIAIGVDAQVSSQAKPTLGIRIAALGGPASQGDTVVRVKTGVRYIVDDANPDGHGHVRLMLMSKSAR